MLNTPILFLIFNRPELTERVFAKIREIQPKQLFIAADGARNNIIGEAEKCVATRKLVLDAIDWNCEVKTLFRNENLGCGKAVSEAITWFFEHVEQGIILEDDCLPELSFFNYCEILLSKFSDNEQISIISGSNFCEKRISNRYDYFIGNMSSIWGWASWSRVFKDYKWGTIYTLDEIRTRMIQEYGQPFTDWQFKIVKDSYEKGGMWDVSFFVQNLMNKKKSITPAVNLISNIGSVGTHFNNNYTNILYIASCELKIDASKDDYCEMPKSVKRKIIKSILSKANPLTIRDRLYLIKIKILNLLR